MPDNSQYRVCFVCSGNICRSPMGQVVLTALAETAGLSHALMVHSAGTGDWHIGERADLRTIRALADAGYDGSAHRARQFDPRWFAELDLVLALDRGHLSTLRSWATTAEDQEKVRLLRPFDPAFAVAHPADPDIHDPYYDGDKEFTDALRLVESACEGVLAHAESKLARVVLSSGA